MNIIFFGTPPFAAIILQKLIDAGTPPVAVVTAPDKPAGRGHHLQSPPVKELADTDPLPLLQPQKLKDEEVLKILRNYTADVFIIAAYGKILPMALLDIPPKGTINVHPSLLPRHRGPSPIQGALLAGDDTMGVTLMLTDKEMDHGPIIAYSKWQMPHNTMTYSKLHERLAELGSQLLVETLPKWIAGEITPQEQNHAEATYTKLLTKEDGHLNWKKSAEEIDRMVRALNPWPGTWSYIKIPEAKLPELRRVKILGGHQTSETSITPPGTLTKTKSGHITASTGTTIYVIEYLQLEGKKPVSDIPSPTPLMLC